MAVNLRKQPHDNTTDTLTLIDTLPNIGFMTVSNGPINKSLQADSNVCQLHPLRQVTGFVPIDVAPAQQPHPPSPSLSGPRPALAHSLLHYILHPVPRHSQRAKRRKKSGRGWR